MVWNVKVKHLVDPVRMSSLEDRIVEAAKRQKERADSGRIVSSHKEKEMNMVDTQTVPQIYLKQAGQYAKKTDHQLTIPVQHLQWSSLSSSATEGSSWMGRQSDYETISNYNYSVHFFVILSRQFKFDNNDFHHYFYKSSCSSLKLTKITDIKISQKLTYMY